MEWWNAERPATRPSSSVMVTHTVAPPERRTHPAATEPCT